MDPAIAASGTEPPSSSLTRSTFWLMVAKTISFSISIILPLLIVRRLNQVEFGHYKQVFLALSTANALLPFGFGMTAFYFFPREPNWHRSVILNILAVYSGIGGLAGAVLLVFPSLLGTIFGDTGLARYSPLMAVLIPLWMLSYLIEIIPIVHKDFSLATGFIVGSQVSRTVLLLIAATVFSTVESLLIAAILHALGQTVVLLRYVGTKLPDLWGCFDGKILQEQFRYALPLGYAGLVWSLQNDLHNYFVSNSFGPAMFAIYATGCFQVPLMGMLSEAAASVLIGKMSELRVQNNTEEMIALTARVMRKLVAAIFPVYVFLLVCGREFIILLFTRNYIDSLPVFTVNITLILLLPVLLDPILRAYPEHMPFLLKMRTFLFVALVACLWFFVSRMGPLSAILIAVGTAVADRALIAHHLIGVLGFRRSHLRLFQDTGRIAICAAIAGGAAALLRVQIVDYPPVVVLGACGALLAAVYVAAAFAMGIPTSDETDSLWRLLRSPRAILASR